MFTVNIIEMHGFEFLCMQKVAINRHIELRERARQLVEQARREAARRSVPQAACQVGKINIIYILLWKFHFK